MCGEGRKFGWQCARSNRLPQDDLKEGALGVTLHDVLVEPVKSRPSVAVYVEEGVAGDDEDALHTLSATAVAAPVDEADIYVGMLMNLGADNLGEDLQEVDLGVNVHVGAVEVYVGYVVTSVGSGDNWNSPAGIIDGGAYIKFDVDY